MRGAERSEGGDAVAESRPTSAPTDQALARGAGTVEEALYFICEAPDMLNDELLATQHRILDELQGRAGARGEGEVRPAVAAAGQAAGKAAAGQAGPDAEARSARVASARARGEAVTECEICLEDVVQSEMEGAQCGHSFCSDCWTAYLNTAIRNGEVLRITCPQAECGREVAEDEIKVRTGRGRGVWFVVSTPRAQAKVARSVFEKYQRFYREAHLRVRVCRRRFRRRGLSEASPSPAWLRTHTIPLRESPVPMPYFVLARRPAEPECAVLSDGGVRRGGDWKSVLEAPALPQVRARFLLPLQ